MGPISRSKSKILIQNSGGRRRMEMKLFYYMIYCFKWLGYCQFCCFGVHDDNDVKNLDVKDVHTSDVCVVHDHCSIICSHCSTFGAVDKTFGISQLDFQVKHIGEIQDTSDTDYTQKVGTEQQWFHSFKSLMLLILTFR